MLHSMDLNRWDKQGAVAWLINLKNNAYIGYGQEKTKKVEKNQNRANTKTNSNSANLNPQSRKTNNAQVAWEKWWRTVIMKNTLKKKTRYSIPVKLLSDEAQLPNQSAPILGTRTPLRSSLSSRKSSPDRSPFLPRYLPLAPQKSPLKSTFSQSNHSSPSCQSPPSLSYAPHNRKMLPSLKILPGVNHSLAPSTPLPDSLKANYEVTRVSLRLWHLSKISCRKWAPNGGLHKLTPRGFGEKWKRKWKELQVRLCLALKRSEKEEASSHSGL